VYYYAGLGSLTAFGGAITLPDNGVLWLAARLSLDGAGALFGLYLVIALGLSLAGRLMRLRGRMAGGHHRLPG
jgi:hypothetical protein